jgi:hypothetical protein
VLTVERLLTFREDRSAFTFRVKRKTFLNYLVSKMEELGSFETSGTIYQPTRPRNIQNDLNLQSTQAVERRICQWELKVSKAKFCDDFFGILDYDNGWSCRWVQYKPPSFKVTRSGIKFVHWFKTFFFNNRRKAPLQERPQEWPKHARGI